MSGGRQYDSKAAGAPIRPYATSSAASPLPIFRKESARNCASADELGHGAGDGFGLLRPALTNGPFL